MKTKQEELEKQLLEAMNRLNLLLLRLKKES